MGKTRSSPQNMAVTAPHAGFPHDAPMLQYRDTPGAPVLCLTQHTAARRRSARAGSGVSERFVTARRRLLARGAVPAVRQWAGSTLPRTRCKLLIDYATYRSIVVEPCCGNLATRQLATTPNLE
ncbi:hypothetical protein J6590_050126 [Homalodisca vitripennis]|nr:hypothetical protein J6590_050126 [Homalodisca vitripennis]